jgi:hypothetical protein
MRAKPHNPAGRDPLQRLHGRRALKLLAVEVGTPESERRWARLAGVPVEELRRLAKGA